ncbi:hypothetical protein MJD09_24820 [bacterium]|nr:hypothetical protein [bacterium]
MVNSDPQNSFRVLTSGCFSAQQTKITWRPAKRRLPAALKHKIEAYWNHEVSQESGRPLLFNGQLCRLDGWQCTSSYLVLTLALSEYKELLYSNSHTAEITAEYGSGALSKALGISAILLSRDDKLVMIRRSEMVGECPGMLDVFGGHIDPIEHSVDKAPDPWLAMRAELLEECGLNIGSNEQLCCLGLIETTLTQKPEMIFLLQSQHISSEILDLGSKVRSTEISEFLCFPRTNLATFIAESGPAISPSAQGALRLFQEYGPN